MTRIEKDINFFIYTVDYNTIDWMLDQWLELYFFGILLVNLEIFELIKDIWLGRIGVARFCYFKFVCILR